MACANLARRAYHRIRAPQSASHDAIAALKTITEVQKVVTIAVAAVALGAAIAAPTPGTIAAALGVLVQAVKNPTAPPTVSTVAKPSTP